MELIKKTNFTELNKEVQLNKKPRIIGLVINGVHYTHTFHVEIFKNNDKLFSKSFGELDKAETRFKTECNKLKKEVKELEQKSLEAIYISNYSSLIRRIVNMTDIKISDYLLSSSTRSDALYKGIEILEKVKNEIKIDNDLLNRDINDLEKELLKFSIHFHTNKTKSIKRTEKPRCSDRVITDITDDGNEIFNYAYINKRFDINNNFNFTIRVFTYYKLLEKQQYILFTENVVITDDELNAKFKELIKVNYKELNMEGAA